MRYVYLDNFRGFSDTILPLRQLTFLVGENSTGKSSFLKMLHQLSSPEFWLGSQYLPQDDLDLGGFEDIVSAWSSDRTFFKVGILTTRKLVRKKTVLCDFAVHVFKDRNGVPHLTRYLQCGDGRLTKIVFHQSATKYKSAVVRRTFRQDDDVIAFFREVLHKDTNNTRGFKAFPKEIPPSPPPLVAVSILNSLEKQKRAASRTVPAGIPLNLHLAWIGPIRTKPQRFYDGTKRSFSPEGDHTPVLLRVNSQTAAFAEKLRAFGEASGLFRTVEAHSFGKDDKSPIEIIVKFIGAKLSINNVGYGVSQVLPLIVEFLSRGKGCTFAVQQPEVHLHPRAQAALGDLVAQLARERQHGFMLETHSDYLIDRCRLNIAQQKRPPGAQVIFFHRSRRGNKASVIPIASDGSYSADQPREFREFFVKEEMSLLGV